MIPGLATGASGSLLSLILREVIFLHERAYIFGLYWMVQNALSSTINLTSSYVNLTSAEGSIAEPLSLLWQWSSSLLSFSDSRLSLLFPSSPTIAPTAVVGTGTLLLYGFTAPGGLTRWAPYLGSTIFQYSSTAIIVISTTFASDVAPKHPGPALVTVVDTKNAISFGVTFGLTPMVERGGYQ